MKTFLLVSLSIILVLLVILLMTLITELQKKEVKSPKISSVILHADKSTATPKKQPAPAQKSVGAQRRIPLQQPPMPVQRVPLATPPPAYSNAVVIRHGDKEIRLSGKENVRINH